MSESSVNSGYLPHSVSRETRADGSIILRSNHPLAAVARCTGEWLHRWAEQTPNHIFIAERSGEGWRELSYAETLQQVRAIAANLLARGMNADTPLIVLSGNGVDHGLLALATQYIGVPMVPLAEQYSLIPDAHPRLRYVMEKVRPAMAYVSDAGRYSHAIQMDVFDGVEIIAGGTDESRCDTSRKVTAFDELLRGDNSVAEQLEAAYAAVGPDTLAKILFTSGSTSNPKGVRTTQRMMCSNQTQLAQALPFLQARPPKVLDWLPWNHVFGGSHNFNMMLANGGSFYCDEGKPVPALFPVTLRNVREQAGTLAFNVPMGFELLLKAMHDDVELRRAYFAEMDLLFYAGASLPQNIWEGLENYALEVRGSLPLMISSWGLTETAPATLLQHEPTRRSGVVGVPLPGVEAKLIPDADMRCEIRVRGPNIMPGYYADDEKTAEAFDEEGFFITGDAMKFVDRSNDNAGMAFDGRISEDFKLLTGTWVRASTLRLEALKVLGEVAGDVVITGHDRNQIGVLIFPKPEVIAALDEAPLDDDGALVSTALQMRLAELMTVLDEQATGSSTRIARALVLAEPPSVKDSEITAKGNLNNRKVLTRRAELVERLYNDHDSAVVRG